MDAIEKLTDEVVGVRLDIRELTVEVRNIKEMKTDVNALKINVARVEDSTKSAHKRLDRYDMQSWAIWLLLLGGLVKMLFDIFRKGG